MNGVINKYVFEPHPASTLHMCTKFEVSILSRFWDMRGSQNLKVGHVTPHTPPSDLVFIFVFKAHSLTCTRKIWGHSLQPFLRYGGSHNLKVGHVTPVGHWAPIYHRVTWYLWLLALSILTCSPNMSFLAWLIWDNSGSLYNWSWGTPSNIVHM